jgi:glutathione S-transferase
MQLYTGNKNYSSWSLRAWLLLRQAGIAFDEVPLRLSFNGDSDFKRALAAVSPAGRVPVLVDDGFAVWDTLAITEYLAERHPEKQLWPADRLQRARARSLCAEMHSGFGALRNHCPMNIEAALGEVGARVLADEPEVQRDLQRIVEMWSEQLAAHGGPLLFGAFSIADAYFAPVCSRIKTYALPVPDAVQRYVSTVLALPAMQAWTRAALAEHDFLDFDEPYRSAPDVAR